MFSLTGSVQVNGKPRNDDHFRKISAFLLQVGVCYLFIICNFSYYLLIGR
jgi:hypothetical protein